MGCIVSIIGTFIFMVVFFPIVVNNFSSPLAQLVASLAVLFWLAIVFNDISSLFKGGKKGEEE